DVDFLAQDYSWSSNGLTTQNPAAVLGMTQPAGQDASHVVDAIMNSSAFSVEAWITPEQAEQLSASPSFIAAIVPATGTDTASIILGQGGNDGPTSWRGSRFGAGFREAGIGFHWLWTHTGAATTNLTHLVVTYRVENDGFKLYVNGSMIRSNSAPSLGLQSSHRINLGHYWTADSSRRWHGTHHQVAFYSRALDAGEIAAHFAAGYGGGRCL
ncbi:MAG: LamG-like jellyroll fold domain-containing protein, partial [Polyangiales bacterium]